MFYSYGAGRQTEGGRGEVRCVGEVEERLYLLSGPDRRWRRAAAPGGQPLPQTTCASSSAPAPQQRMNEAARGTKDAVRDPNSSPGGPAACSLRVPQYLYATRSRLRWSTITLVWTICLTKTQYSARIIQKKLVAQKLHRDPGNVYFKPERSNTRIFNEQSNR